VKYRNIPLRATTSGEYIAGNTNPLQENSRGLQYLPSGSESHPAPMRV